MKIRKRYPTKRCSCVLIRRYLTFIKYFDFQCSRCTFRNRLQRSGLEPNVCVSVKDLARNQFALYDLGKVIEVFRIHPFKFHPEETLLREVTQRHSSFSTVSRTTTRPYVLKFTNSVEPLAQEHDVMCRSKP